MGRKKLTVTRKTKFGKNIRYKTPDKGAPGRTPKKDRWYRPSVHTGWEKNQPADQRRRLVLKAHGGDYLAAGRAMQALSNVTADERTKLLAGRDARYFFRKNRDKKN